MVLLLFLRNWLFLLLLFVVNSVLPLNISRKFFLLSNYKANNHKANRPLLVQMLIRGSVERRHFPHSGNSTDCGRPVYDDDDDHDDCSAGHIDSDEEEDNNAFSPLG